MKVSGFALVTTLVLLMAAACSAEDASEAPASLPDDAPTEPPTEQAATPTRNEPTPPDTASVVTSPLDIDFFEPFSGDLSALQERRQIRALVPWSDTYYYLDGAEQKGIAFEAARGLERWLNEDLASGTVEMHVVILPVRRDLLLSYVAEGRGDIALGGITVTDARAEQVDFTDNTSKAFEEWLVEAQSADRLDSIDDLSGRVVHVRRSSSYFESLAALNEDFQSRGLAPVEIETVYEYLSTEDLMQLANSGAIDYTVADSEIAQFWSNALTQVRVREDIVLRENAHTAWALRKGSTELKSLLNRFVHEYRQGTLMGNVVLNRYLKDTSRLATIADETTDQRFDELIEHFREFSHEHEFDTLMMVAQGFQESRLDQSKRSHRGALGVMQLLPSTAAEPAVNVPDITTAQNNILAGVRYMAWIRDTYFDDPELDNFNQTALAFASYNAGPNRIRRLRQQAETRGLNPNEWFNNVEIIAAEDIGSETVDYVANIFKYYTAFELSKQFEAERASDQP